MRALAICIAAFILAGCATIVTGPGHSQTIHFKSEPPGATVFVDGNRIGVTPLSMEVSRKSEHHIRIEMAGYQANDQVIKHGPNPWAFGNCIFGLVGIGGAILDAADGADDGLLSTHDINANLAPSPQVSEKRPAGIQELKN